VTALGLSDEQWTRLMEASEKYRESVCSSYDEVFDQVIDRVARNRWLDKRDIGVLVFWKRLRADAPWATRLHCTPDEDVRSVTTQAVAAVHNAETPDHVAAADGRRVLSSLPGFGRGDALASALLTAAAPDRMAVYDRRAHAGLGLLDLGLTNAPGRYGRYMALVGEIVAQARERGTTWRPRDVDLALYQLGGRRKTAR